jgi:glycosyltransferase involved in cell wall biosynthesis
MSEYPLISVVLPVYNCSLYIEEAINSILNQTIQDFEIIVIDDYSTDETVAIVQSINDSRIKLILKEENKGLIDSLNIGFKEAKGKYIARMDGDDISLPSRFKKQLEVLENTDIKVCGCWLQRFGKSNVLIRHKEYHDEIVAHLLLSCSMSMGSVMFDRKTFETFSFDESKKHVEDYDFWARVAWSGKFYNIQEVLYNYRAHDTQVTQLYNDMQRQGDIGIKLFLFKKLKYNTEMFSDEMISKMLLLNKPIEIKEFKLFLKWLKELILLNRKSQVFSSIELVKVLKIIKRSILFSLYFEKTSIGITKKWRTKVLFGLQLSDVFFVLKIKAREILKTKLS